MIVYTWFMDNFGIIEIITETNFHSVITSVSTIFFGSGSIKYSQN